MHRRCAIWLLGDLSGTFVVSEFALVAMAQSIVVTIWGTQAAGTIRFPLLYLYFLVPVGESLIAPLQIVTADLTVALLKATSVPVRSDGLMIILPHARWLVAEACAGVKFLIASIALGALLSAIFLRSFTRRALFMALSVAVPILANGFRAFIVVLIGYLSNNAAAASADHILYGWVIFAVVLLAMVAIAVVMREPEDAHDVALPEADRRSKIGSPSAVLYAALCSLLIVASFQASASSLSAPPIHSGTPSRLPISVRPPWTAIEAKDSSPPMFHGADRVWTQTYSDGSAKIYLSVAYFDFERPGAEVASSQHQLEGVSPGIPIAETTENVRVAGQVIRAGELTFTRYNRRRVLLHWFWVDDRFTGNPYVAKLLQLNARLLDGNNAAAIVVSSTDVMGDESAAKRALARFAEAFRLTPKPVL